MINSARLILLCSVFLFCLLACKKNSDKSNVSTPYVPPPVLDTGVKNWIVVTNGTSKELEAYDPSKQFTDAGACKWIWKPTTSLGFSATEVSAFGGGSDVKARTTSVWPGVSQVIVVADGRFAAIANFDTAGLSGQKLWAISWSSVTNSGNLHSAELLPDGNLALAASDGNWIRVYNTTTPTSNNFASFTLNQAHGVLWDPGLNRLWVIGQIPGGDHVLTALIVGGTKDSPTLTEDLNLRAKLPGVWGHDLSPYYGDPNKLLVSMNCDCQAGGTSSRGVAIFDKTLHSFTWVGGSANRTMVKAISRQPGTGQFVETQPNSTCSNGWSTPYIDFYTAGGSYQYSRSLPGSCLYKAKVFMLSYQ